LSGAERPLPDATHIDVNETRQWIVTNSPKMQCQGGIAQIERTHAWDANVNRLGLHMTAVRGHAQRMAAQKLVAPGRAISANHVDFSAGPADALLKSAEQIEEARIVIVDRTGPMITEELVEAGKRRGNVLVAPAIDEVNALAGMGVKHPQTVFGVARSWPGSVKRYRGRDNPCGTGQGQQKPERPAS
jgi:hypothetical protein